MKEIMKSIEKTENKIDTIMEHFFFCHPFFGYLTAFIGVPIFIITIIFISTTIITFPLAIMFNWF